MNRESALIACLCLSVACTGEPTRKPAYEAPHLRVQGEASQLIVDGQPFLMLAGELGNSTASDLDYLRRYWPRLQALHLNTVLAPVYWELIEPEEGQFDFALVDGLIEDARAHDMRLVLLWFGSWKNSMSSYAPAWVKRDQQRFPRAQTSDGRGLGTDEIFMAWHFAVYTEAVAAAGRAECDVPLFVNAALIRPGRKPGEYPSSHDVRLGELTLHVGFVDPWTPREKQTIAAHGGLMIQLGPEEYFIAGRGLILTFSADEGIVGIGSIWEGAYEDGRWNPGRLLNGDQSHQGRHLRLPPEEYSVQRVRLYRYE